MGDAVAAAAEARPPEGPAAEAVAARAVRVALVLALLAAGAQTVAGVVNGIALDHRFRTLDPDREHTVFAWASAGTSFAAAFAAVLLALESRAVRGWAIVVALVFAFFSLDDLLVVHEPLTRDLFVDRLGLPLGLGGRMSAVLYLPLLLAAVAGLLACARRAPRPARLGLLAGLACLAAAVALELANGALQSARVVGFRQPADVLISGAEEGLELAGLVLVAGSLAACALAAAFCAGLTARTEPPAPPRP